MKFLFVDESDKKEAKYFLLCGIIIEDKYLLKLNNELQVLKNLDNLQNLKDSRKTNLSENKRVELTEKIFTLLAKSECKVLSGVLGEYALSASTELLRRYDDASFFVIERFVLQLRQFGQFGFVIFDSSDKKLQRKLEDKFYEKVLNADVLMHSNRLGEYKEFLFPTLFFARDEYTNIIQAADLIAVSLNGALWSRKKNLGHFGALETLYEENKFLSIYWPLFLKSPQGKVRGWGIKLWE